MATTPTRALTVGDIMSRSVLTTEAGASVATAACMYASEKRYRTPFGS